MPTKITVAIPVYNREGLIGQAIQSVLNQGYSDLELIIIDNCSTDDTFMVAKQFESSCIRVLRNDSNLGMGGNFKRCMEEARGDWFRFLMSDDQFLPGALSLVDEIENIDSEVDVILTPAESYELQLTKVVNREAAIKNSIQDPEKILCLQKRFHYHPFPTMPNAYAIKTHLIKRIIEEDKFIKIFDQVKDTGHCLDFLIFYASVKHAKKIAIPAISNYSVRTHKEQGSAAYIGNLIYHVTGDYFVVNNLLNPNRLEQLGIFRHAISTVFSKLKTVLRFNISRLPIFSFDTVKLFAYLISDILSQKAKIRKN